jgi:hypothetical protein
MATIKEARAVIRDQCSPAQAKEGFKYAESIGYDNAEEFFSIAMAKILYSADDIARGARYPVEPGSLDT